MKKYLALVLAVLMALTCVALVACGETGCEHTFVGGKCSKCGDPDPNATLAATDTTISDAALKCTNTGKIYVTSLGTAGYDTLLDLLADATFEYTAELTLAPSAVSGNDILIVVAGASTKGMGDAGISTQSEVERAQAFAAVSGLEIIVIQNTGKGQRGESSDPIYKAICPAAKATLIIADANSDNLFTTNCPAGTLYLFSRGSKMKASLNFLLNV